MKYMLAKDAWKEMTDRDPIMGLIKSTFKLAFEPHGKCRCDVCKRKIADYEMVYQNETKPITICEQCYNPENDYASIIPQNTFNVTVIPGIGGKK